MDRGLAFMTHFSILSLFMSMFSSGNLLEMDSFDIHLFVPYLSSNEGKQQSGGV